MIDLWDTNTFSIEIQRCLKSETRLLLDYHTEKRRLMDEHLNSSPYQSLKPNRFASDYFSFQENEMSPILAVSRVRVWHYSRLLEYEVDVMQQRLIHSSLDFLKKRLHDLVEMNLLTQDEADSVFQDSPFQLQENIRTGRLWAVASPRHYSDTGVLHLLESWGGESAYFWVSNKALATKLKTIGLPRILEIETSLSDGHNAFFASGMVLCAWARNLGISVDPIGGDLAITNCLGTAKLVKVHTEGESSYDAVAHTYPIGVQEKIT